MAGNEFVTRATIEAVMNVLQLLLDHNSRMAEDAKTATVAMRRLLEKKGIVSESEWDAAVDRVRAEEETLFALDPEAQKARDEVRRLLGGRAQEEQS